MFRDESPGSPGSDDAARARVDPLRSSPERRLTMSLRQHSATSPTSTSGADDAVFEQLDALAAA
jgi:hypothetical protein